MIVKRMFSLAVFVLLLAAAVARGDQPPYNVVLIGWDGAQRDHVKECLARGELPALKALADEGAMVDIDIIGATDTKAGWTQILTGYNPEVTGVSGGPIWNSGSPCIALLRPPKRRYWCCKFRIRIRWWWWSLPRHGAKSCMPRRITPVCWSSSMKILCTSTK